MRCEAQGALPEAEQLLRRALSRAEEHYGRVHPETLGCATALATVWAAQEKLDEAEVMCRRALTCSEELYGDKHPKTLSAMSRLRLPGVVV